MGPWEAKLLPPSQNTGENQVLWCGNSEVEDWFCRSHITLTTTEMCYCWCFQVVLPFWLTPFRGWGWIEIAQDNPSTKKVGPLLLLIFGGSVCSSMIIGSLHTTIWPHSYSLFHLFLKCFSFMMSQKWERTFYYYHFYYNRKEKNHYWW